MSDTTYTFDPISLFGYAAAIPSGVNNAGTIVGYVSFDNDGTTDADGFSGTVGQLTTFSYPSSPGTVAYGINAAGVIVGSYVQMSVSSGFILQSGAFTSVQILPTALQTLSHPLILTPELLSGKSPSW